MRAIWKGAVSFGLVNVPVKVYAATGDNSVSFHQVHRADGGRVKYKRTCSVDGEEIPYGEIAKGYETEDGELVLITDEDLASLPLSTSREIDVLEFVPAEQVDPILFAKCYFLEPEKSAAKPYALLREALQTTERVAVVKVALRQRETMAVLRVRDKVILLQTMLWPDEVREADFDILDAEVDVRPQELQMASSLVQSLAADFDPDQYEDQYAAALEAMIEAKVSSGDTSRVPQAEDDRGGGGRGGEVVDLLTALQRSVDKARSSRGAAPGGGSEAASDDAGTGRAGARQASAKKTATKSPSATKKSATKPATTKKSATTKAATTKAAASKKSAPKSAAKKTTRARKSA